MYYSSFNVDDEDDYGYSDGLYDEGYDENRYREDDYNELYEEGYDVDQYENKLDNESGEGSQDSESDEMEDCQDTRPKEMTFLAFNHPDNPYSFNQPYTFGVSEIKEMLVELKSGIRGLYNRFDLVDDKLIKIQKEVTRKPMVEFQVFQSSMDAIAQRLTRMEQNETEFRNEITNQIKDTLKQFQEIKVHLERLELDELLDESTQSTSQESTSQDLEPVLTQPMMKQFPVPLNDPIFMKQTVIVSCIFSIVFIMISSIIGFLVQ